MHGSSPPALAIITIFVSSALAAAAGTGGGELSLDRAAVAAVIEAGLPREKTVELPAGQVTLQFEPPETVNFVNGGLEARVGVRAAGLGLGGLVALRFVPEIDTASGSVFLRVAKAVPEGAASFLPDVSGLLPRVAVPSGYDWKMQLDGGREREMRVNVKDVRITSDRLVIEWEFVTQ